MQMQPKKTKKQTKTFLQLQRFSTSGHRVRLLIKTRGDRVMQLEEETDSQNPIRFFFLAFERKMAQLCG